ncbi:MAG: RluA family pseudouridine synthase [Clostridia bacterium]|nr:RluA family pseudouridine synthase [Clostridia bacterium]
MIEKTEKTTVLSESEVLSLTAEAGGVRLDVFTASVTGETRSFSQRMIESGDVLVNGKAGKANTKLKAGDEVNITLKPPKEIELVGEDIPLDIVYEDEDIVVVNKAKGMVVHVAPGHESGTMVNALMHHVKDLSGIGGELRPGIVHRIDKLTSGLVVVAKNDMAHRSLSEQIKEHTAHRTYMAIVDGNIKTDGGTVDAPIGRDINDRKKMAVCTKSMGREAITHYKVLTRYGEYTLLELQLETGRTHQIRVHMAHIKHPVTGDIVYGRKKCPIPSLDGQALHAFRLSLDHPRTGERMTFEAELPDWFKKALAYIEKRYDIKE